MSEHCYALFVEGTPVGRLEWRSAPRDAAGWWLRRDDGRKELLPVDSAIDELRSSATEHAWPLHAEVAAILSTAQALDTAGRVIHDRPRTRTRRFARRERTPLEIYLRGISPGRLSRTVPEMALSSVSDVVVLEGTVSTETLTTLIRRLELLGGTIVEVIARNP